MKNQVVSIALLCVLVSLVAFKPWHKINRVTGLETVADSLRADSTLRAQQDSVFVEPNAGLSVVLPPTISDSLADAVDRREKKQHYLKEQVVLLDKENDKLEAKVKQKTARLNENVVSLSEIDKLLAKQSAKHSSKNLGVSGADSEVSQRSKSNQAGSSNP